MQRHPGFHISFVSQLDMRAFLHEERRKNIVNPSHSPTVAFYISIIDHGGDHHGDGGICFHHHYHHYHYYHLQNHSLQIPSFCGKRSISLTFSYPCAHYHPRCLPIESSSSSSSSFGARFEGALGSRFLSAALGVVIPEDHGLGKRQMWRKWRWWQLLLRWWEKSVCAMPS